MHLTREMQLAMFDWHCFRFTTRFVDDMDTVVNPLFESLMHTDQALAGGLIKGIYPRSTPIQAQGHPMYRVPYLDVLKVYTRQADRWHGQGDHTFA
jgi:hypothetical protein